MKQLQIALPLVFILVLALGLRLPHLTGSFWLDEAAQALESARPLSQQFDIIPDFQPPLLHLILHFAMYISSSEWWLRLWGALIPGLVTIAVTYKLGEKMGNRATGIIASVLLATSSFHIFYSQELRQYSLPTMFAVLSWWALVQLKKPNSWQAWVPFVVWSTLGLYSSFLYPFLMIGQAVWLLAAKRTWLKPGFLALVVAGLCFTPWLPMFRLQLEAGGIVRQDLPGWAEVVSIPQLKSLPLVVGKFVYGVMDIELTPFFVITFAALVAGAAYLKITWYKHAFTAKNLQPHLLLAIWMVVPLLTAWIVSFWIPVVQPKRVLFLLPAFYLMISLMVTQLQTVRASRWIYAVVALLLSINLISTAEYYFNPLLQRENWRAVHQEILRKYPADQSITAFVFPEPFAPWRWYDDGTYPTWSTGTLHINQVPDLRSRVQELTEYEYIVVFSYLADLSDPDNKTLQEIQAYGYQTVELIDYPNLGFIRVYARPETVMSMDQIEQEVGT